MPAEGATSSARKVLAESKIPPLVIVPTVHSPMGLAQLVVVNVL
jgi:hypothetical protein